MTIQKHIHRVKRLKYKNGEAVFFCTLDNCHYKINVELSIGKTFSCNRCGKSFTMNVLTKRMARPHCDDCTKKQEKNIPSINISPVEIRSSISDVEALKRKLRNTLAGTVSEYANMDSQKDEDDML